jgi:hypothetical protein
VLARAKLINGIHARFKHGISSLQYAGGLKPVLS